MFIADCKTDGIFSVKLTIILFPRRRLSLRLQIYIIAQALHTLITVMLWQVFYLTPRRRHLIDGCQEIRTRLVRIAKV